MAGTLPPMLHVMRDIGGIDVPDSLAKLTGEESGKAHVAGHAADRERSTVANGDEEAPVVTGKPRV
jgi:hypothetical protein